MRRAWIGTSWKMNKTRAEAATYLAELRDWSQTSGLDADIAIFPPFTALATAAAQLDSSRRPANAARAGQQRPSLHLGGQNMHWKPSGAQTGEISAEMLLDCGASIVELGHYERRRHHGETDRSVNLKAKAAITIGLETVICVGDCAEDRQYGVAAEVVARQVKIALGGLPPRALTSVVLAYEPAWAIGTSGQKAEPAHVEAIHQVIRTAVRQSHDARAAELVRVVYGGSVDTGSASDYATQTTVDGLFVGRTGLTAAGFIGVIEKFCAAAPDATGELVRLEGRAHDSC
jgi:L-erythrulose 1-phosphate isomerase